ncbi:hypothetical protein QBC42DRAFT_325097 [Cladorrhinum samala]|uniref:DUF1772-domain-containing protein n=1 Tax=Cladorrhinum samala TaxID=585594 RepID=A0AAV9HRZ9_9PEZI|nr:hypothetical protein QBC42DRAFT_325097 [Cladorrhinum samala]
MSHQSPDLRVLKASTLLLSGLASGLSLSLSVFLTPRLLEAPVPVMLKQWKSAFISGRASMPLLSAAAAAGYFYLAAKSRAGAAAASSSSMIVNSFRLFVAAGAMTLGIVPYTLGVMMGTNNKLIEREGDVNGRGGQGQGHGQGRGQGRGRGAKDGGGGIKVTAEVEKSSRGLVDWWGVLNLGRAGMMILGMGLGLGGIFLE